MGRTGVKMTLLFVGLVHLCLVLVAYGRETFLFGTKPTGGLWGVAIDGRGDGSITRMLNLGYPVTSKMIKNIAFDSVKNTLLMEEELPRSLSYESICSGNNDEPSYIASGFSSIPVHGIADCWDCKVTALTIHDSVIYFLLAGDFGDLMDVKKKVQIRKLDQCSDCAKILETIDHDDTSSKLERWHYTVKCSSVVATLIDKKEGDSSTDYVGLSLKPVEMQGELKFFLHMKEYVADEEDNHNVYFSLYYVTPSDVTMMNRIKLDNRYVTMGEIWGLGSLDYQNELLCWTAGSVVRCADFQASTLGEIHDITKPGDTAINQICTGSQANATALVTGLAISDVGADGSKVLYVGCYAQSPDTGGLGLLKVKADWSVEHFVPVNEGGRSLMGGVLVHMEALPPTCPATNPQPTFCIPPDWPTTIAPSTVTTPIHSTPKPELYTTKPPGKPGQEKPDQTSGGDKDTISEQVSPSTGAITRHTLTAITLTLISLFLL